MACIYESKASGQTFPRSSPSPILKHHSHRDCVAELSLPSPCSETSTVCDTSTKTSHQQRGDLRCCHHDWAHIGWLKLVLHLAHIGWLKLGLHWACIACLKVGLHWAHIGWQKVRPTLGGHVTHHDYLSREHLNFVSNEQGSVFSKLVLFYTLLYTLVYTLLFRMTSMLQHPSCLSTLQIEPRTAVVQQDYELFSLSPIFVYVVTSCLSSLGYGSFYNTIHLYQIWNVFISCLFVF